MLKDFYSYRIEVRKKLGRSQLYPEKVDIYKLELIGIFRENKDFTEMYLEYLTSNEKRALESLFDNTNQIKQLLVLCQEKVQVKTDIISG